ncbi:HET domain-containing protein [Nannizzia gypsea CBS 118893]|uniref:HET domain-containing protein n=1 Tax=Arthroderma gypseum (strain ATCC MYA-4604 / CBS 118893) TaxID=535722 RepID=E4UZQ1_ARTGP|nr:HET domain-containing protein [Nannizzia gypsea CBS 118893]EFR03581.1 HET domain-containing protein [Nannizzia gypsea CBS 118893]
MRLLNAWTLRVEEFFDDSTLPRYAILSHRWQDEEVSLQQLRDGQAAQLHGYKKLADSCSQALRDGFDYVWIDTCCIDKTSSAELSEALNSMFQWYQRASVCYAYLFDVDETSITSKESSTFYRSAWFTRGWTLQELLAPATVEFFNGAWQRLGTKVKLKDAICEVTGIHPGVLTGELDLQSFSVAQRMSWAARRTTAKVEDRAYSLLGIFGINMPMLYGEGERAFLRLQEEIMKQSDDHTLFAWKSSDQNFRGLFAKSPAAFADSGNLVQSASKWNMKPYSLTNMGLSIELAMVEWSMGVYLAALDCQTEGVQNSRVGIFLSDLPEKNQYARIMLDGVDLPRFSTNRQSQYRYIYVRQNIRGSLQPTEREYGFWLRRMPKPNSSPDATFDVTAWNKSWTRQNMVFTIPKGESGTAVVIRYKPEVGITQNVKLGFDPKFNPVCQFGGQYYSPKMFGSPARDTFDGIMATDWMNPRLEGVHVGDKEAGLNIDDYIRILILKETVKGKEMWVVYIAHYDEEAVWYRDRVCDGCHLTIFGKLYRCSECSGFDYCEDCYAKADKTHPQHRFKKDKPVCHSGVKCDSCSSKVYGSRYKCSRCPDFDLCCYCFADAMKIHPQHQFKEIKKP